MCFSRHKTLFVLLCELGFHLTVIILFICRNKIETFLRPFLYNIALFKNQKYMHLQWYYSFQVYQIIFEIEANKYKIKKFRVKYKIRFIKIQILFSYLESRKLTLYYVKISCLTIIKCLHREIEKWWADDVCTDDHKILLKKTI